MLESPKQIIDNNVIYANLKEESKHKKLPNLTRHIPAMICYLQAL